MNKVFVGTFCLCVAFLGGCERTHVFPVSDEAFPPARSASRVEVVSDDGDTRPHRVLAVVDSKPSKTRTAQVRADLLSDLRRRAGEIGAEALVDVEWMTEEHEGLTRDDGDPTWKVRFTDDEVFFLRGRAIVFEEAAAVSD